MISISWLVFSPVCIIGVFLKFVQGSISSVAQAVRQGIRNGAARGMWIQWGSSVSSFVRLYANATQLIHIVIGTGREMLIRIGKLEFFFLSLSISFSNARDLELFNPPFGTL